MLSQEPGNLSGSHYYFFQPSEIAKSHYYYMTWCGHYFCGDGYRIERDYFPDLLVVYVRKGMMHLRYEGKQHQVTKGEAYLIDCNFPHMYASTDGLEFLYFHFDGCNSHSLCRHLIKQNGGPVFRSEHNKTVEKVIFDTVTRYLHYQDLSELEASQAIYSAICAIGYTGEIRNYDSAPVKDSIRFMERNFDRQFTLQDVADHVNLSPYYYSHLFKKITGFAPMEYATRIRLEAAKTMLKSTQMTTTEIAYTVGYSSSAGFINAFTRNVGLSPNKFRKMRI